ncbi:PRD domain-containing protein [Enterococcus pseudoavium]|uniref:PRD domain-containing protein n=1 Tax=Enterococcus pseudoavium TaxID=44007 RepID=A0ABU3FK43_9ENTE|nr:PRD domain-containing protein [Enterococcus pseudoavium]MDT2753579.1 PRD domain-containing protein [Enterococcus pseudoavium]MDT2771441.1 PRD domain-containing protein [Enterococcus pseudoavium]REC32450.1 transcription antiterminator LicT [Enterococcus pseudoavium]
MQIQKILNNNVVITTDEKNNEIVVMGRGLAFKKKVGDEIAETAIDKSYHLANNDLFHKFQELLEDMPISYVEIANDIIDEAKVTLKNPLNDSLYISITDHLYAAIQRVQEGVRVRNLLLWDVKRLFPDEFSVGLDAVKRIEEKFKIDLGEDEAGNIALHLVNAQTESDNEDAYLMAELMQEIIQITSYYFKVQLDEESVYFYRFTTHLRFFASRIMNHRQLTDETDDELLVIIQRKYQNAYQCVERIAEFILKKYHYEMSNDEKLYLTIHIARLVQKVNQ